MYNGVCHLVADLLLITHHAILNQFMPPVRFISYILRLSREPGPVSREYQRLSYEYDPISSEHYNLSCEANVVSREYYNLSREPAPVSRERSAYLMDRVIYHFLKPSSGMVILRRPQEVSDTIIPCFHQCQEVLFYYAKVLVVSCRWRALLPESNPSLFRHEHPMNLLQALFLSIHFQRH